MPAKPSTRPRVFWISLIGWLGLLGYCVFFRTQTLQALPALNRWVTTNFGDLYIVALSLFLGVVLLISVSPIGKLRLGGENAKPEFRRGSWYAMLLSAGMGIGLVFNGVAEPILLYDGPVQGASRSMQAAAQAMPLTYFHWGFSAWAGYVVMALCVAWTAYQGDGKFSLRETLRPLFGTWVDGVFGDLVDISAVLGTLVGLAASLGLGAQQIVTGLARLGWIEPWPHASLVAIALITIAATVSLVSGLDRGIRRLSELNIILAVLLALFVCFAGPWKDILRNFFEHSLEYLGVLLTRGLRTPSQAVSEAQWMQRWTVPYWAWWISWAPFVGIFIARISKGRSIRDLVWSAVLLPSFATFAWFEAFGGAALMLPKEQRDSLADVVVADISTSVFAYLELLPLAGMTCVLAMLVVTIFFVSSSDSASYVVDMLTSGGHPNPPKWQRIFWAVAEGLCAGTLLYIGGKDSLHAMHSVVIAAALPYTLWMLLMLGAFCRSIYEYKKGATHARAPDGT